MGINAYGSANFNELRYIESALTQFEFGHERLALTDPPTQFNLSDAGILSSLYE
jgi:hypothetical protein